MSCCPTDSSQQSITGALVAQGGSESDIHFGESLDCYAARTGNSTNKMDDATDVVVNKIDNTSIPIVSTKTTATVNVKFKLSAGSDRTVTTWTKSEASGNSVSFSTAGITLSGDTLSGSFSSPGLNQKYTVTITASDGTGDIDSRTFTFFSYAGESKIQLLSPLPGAIINSKFGLRMHPIYKVMKMHTGVDMVYADKSVKNVLAAADGTVSLAGGNPSVGYGIQCQIKHVDSSGKDICITTYNHLNKVLVSQGQKVMAGQAIGIEGTTGSSTGNHLHFEVKLTNGTFVDPEPFFREPVSVAQLTNSDGTAVSTSLVPSTPGASLSSSEAAARSTSCPPYGSTYPPLTPSDTLITPPVTVPTDPFERAWYFTLLHEVGPWWLTGAQYSPGDPDVDNGATETADQRKKTGYVTDGRGGETKFGITQKCNTNVMVKTMTYLQAKTAGYTNYWLKGPNAHSDRVAIMLFDISFLHGPGGTNTIMTNAGITTTTGFTPAQQITACESLNTARLAYIKAIQDPKYQNGWITRSNDCLAFIQSI